MPTQNRKQSESDLGTLRQTTLHALLYVRSQMEVLTDQIAWLKNQLHDLEEARTMSLRECRESA